ncbi:MAG TPA: rRNA maturation RNase YbeY [Vicinamibacterales bacterium]|nr:rRNA maturation RNase YbeY [Vicinamibacterales bacterium]
MPLAITLTDGRGRPVRVRGLAAWLRRVAPARARGAVTIALVGDARMRQLNRAFRGKDYATDVLSFPADPRPHGPRYLGDIVVATGVARRQAREQGHSEAVELRVLSLHGLLHLLGYDHERDHGEMRRVEQRLLTKGGIPSGLILRARGSTRAPRAKSRAARPERVEGRAR